MGRDGAKKKAATSLILSTSSATGSDKLVIMEYFVKISKKARILELKRRNIKITVLTSYTTYPSRKIRLIMEYLVKISKKARILELKRRNIKIIVLTSYTTYPSRKIRRIYDCTSLKTTKEQDQYVVSRSQLMGQAAALPGETGMSSFDNTPASPLPYANSPRFVGSLDHSMDEITRSMANERLNIKELLIENETKVATNP
ncbi:hypothetical protein Tco_1207943 [Tanacetum coccineum]